MRRRDDILTGSVETGVDRERRGVDGAIADDDLALVVDTDEIAHRHVLEVLAERVDPEVVEVLGIADRHVAGDALGEPEPAENAQSAGESLLAVEALLLDGLSGFREREADVVELGLESADIGTAL